MSHTPTCEQQPCRQLATPAPPSVDSGSAASVAVGVTTALAFGRPRNWSADESLSAWPNESLETVALTSGFAAAAAEALRSLAVRRTPCGGVFFSRVFFPWNVRMSDGERRKRMSQTLSKICFHSLLDVLVASCSISSLQSHRVVRAEVCVGEVYRKRDEKKKKGWAKTTHCPNYFSRFENDCFFAFFRRGEEAVAEERARGEELCGEFFRCR